MDTNAVTLLDPSGTASGIINLVPAKWRDSFVFFFGLSVILGRVVQALRTGGGLKGVLSSIWLGTNLPKPVASAIDLGATKASGFIRVALLMLVAFLSLVVISCAMLKPGADPLVVRTEQAVRTADSTFELVLHLDNADRGFWRTNAPAFHAFCEWLRQPVIYGGSNVARAIAMPANVDDLKLAYKVNKDLAGSNTLYLGLITLESATGQASSWENIVTNRVH